MGNTRVTVLIVFNAGAQMYGMERAVIETFDLLRPEVEPHFLMSYTTQRLGLPILDQIEKRNFARSFFSDETDWPRIGRPRSLVELWQMIVAIILGNKDVLRAARGKDIIYIPGTSYYYYAALALVVHRLVKRRTVYHFHDLLTRPSTLLRVAAWFTTDFVHNTRVGCDTTIAVNPWLKRKQNHVIPCPVRAGKALKARRVAPDFCQLKRQVFFVGQVSLHKGIDLLLDAFQVLAQSHADLILNVVGGCEDPALQRRLENGSKGGEPRVKWWGYREEVMQILQDAYLYVHPSPPSRFHESFGLGLVEAMSLGIPSVCFRSGVLAEIMVHGETGLICEDEDASSLAKSMDRILSDVDFRDYCGEQALRRYRDCFSAAYIKRSWLTVLGAN
jgi:glycosyltransferase involved in cell wall biosynthesis